MCKPGTWVELEPSLTSDEMQPLPRSAVASFFTVIRWKEWATSKIPFFFSCMFYAALARPATDTGVMFEMLGLLLILCLYAAFGYSLNAIVDRDTDRAAGKRDKLGEMPERRVSVSFWSIVVAGIAAPLLIYWDRPDVLAVLGIAYAVALGYSAPPIRLKERGIAGIICAAAAQRTIPVILIFVAMRHWGWTAFWLCALSTLIGIRYIIIHQILDEKGDLATGARTSATTHGTIALRHALKMAIFPTECAVLFVTVVSMATSHLAVAVMTAIYLAWLFLQYLTLGNENEYRRFSVDSYYVLEEFYNFYLPLMLAILLAASNPAFWSLAAFTVLWRIRLVGRELRNIARVASSTFRAVSSRA
jgi:4-hydroxybenzoate polyprenyltransferase